MLLREITGEQVTRSGRVRWAAAPLAAACSLIMAGTAAAGMISGELRDGGKLLKGVEIEVKDSRNNLFRVKSDQNGRYSVNLPPGIYRAGIAHDKSKGELILQSSPQPSRQDLSFGKR